LVSAGRQRRRRTCLPWISVNHPHGITGLEDFDKALFPQLAKGNQINRDHENSRCRPKSGKAN
jgi:hypothetical protein